MRPREADRDIAARHAAPSLVVASVMGDLAVVLESEHQRQRRGIKGAEDDLRVRRARFEMRQVDIPEGSRFPRTFEQRPDHPRASRAARLQSIVRPRAM